MTLQRHYNAALLPVYNRGRPTAAFLDQLLDWADTRADDIFAPNPNPVDIFAVIKSSLATPMGHDPSGTPIYQWGSLLHRKAALLEAMRVHAGTESSWNFDAGVDVTNPHSLANQSGQETGVFQVSWDSELLNHGAIKPFAIAHGIQTPATFIPAMKSNHQLAFEYYARLVRISIRWAGPLLRHGENSIYPWLRRQSVAEFMGLLS